LNLDCGSYLGQYTGGALKQGLVDEGSINNVVSNNFATLMRLGPKDVCTPENQELACEAAKQGIVLLKNSPVIGPNANATRAMIGNYEGINISYLSNLRKYMTWSYCGYNMKFW